VSHSAESATHRRSWLHRLASGFALGRTLLALREQARRDHLGIIAAGAAFFMFLSIVPGLTAVTLLYGYLADEATVLRHVDMLAGYAPEAVRGFARSELERIVSNGSSGLGVGFVGSVVLTIIFASRGTRALIEGLNLIERETERRGAIALYALSLAFTVAAVVLATAMLALLVALPAVIDANELGSLLWIGQYVGLPLLLLGAVMALFRFGGSGAARRRWWSVGAVAATLSWLLASKLLQVYVQYVDLETAFGSSSTVAVFMLWLYLCCLSLLLGAEVDDVLHHGRQR
jgi:membrane protein